MNMLLVGFFKWWYGAGFFARTILMRERMKGTIDFFSFSLIARTFFAPFRQISNYHVRGSLSMQFRAWFDRLFSRMIGAVVRTIILLVGVIALLVQSIFGIILLIFWAIMPVIPLVGIGLFILSVRIG